MSSGLKNTAILVVDDNADTCDLLRVALEASGALVVVAQTVEAALEAFRRSPPHAVVADIRLRTSDGYALIDAIRKCNVEYKGFTPVIAVTGFASPEDKERALSAGFSAYLTKPFDPAEVVRAVSYALAGSVDPAA
jgi:CheY-like chemotaxis protein